MKIFGLPQLEILDFSRNKISEVPDEIEQMKALRVFSIQHNNIGDLPFCLGSINTLRILKLTGNPLTPRLKRIVEGSDVSPGPSPAFVDNEFEKDTMSTKKVLEYLRTLAAAKDSEGDSRYLLQYVDFAYLLTNNVAVMDLWRRHVPYYAFHCKPGNTDRTQASPNRHLS